MAEVQLSHLDAAGRVRMVEVGDRPATAREAVAEGWLRLPPALLQQLLAGTVPKGDVLAVARVAAIQGAKRTAELIPLCHPLPLTGVDVAIEPAEPEPGATALRVTVSARTTASTGVEMEALTAVQVALLTLYDMLKAVEPGLTLGPVRLLRKTGGRHGAWTAAATTSPMTSPAPSPEPFPAEGLPLAEARRQLLQALVPPQQTEVMPLAAAAGRVTAAPVMAPEAVPGFAAAILDGYAIADREPPVAGQRWTLVGRAAPGAPYPTALGPGEAVRILTGAPLPAGAWRVLAQERVTATDEQLELHQAMGADRWVRAADEEVAAGAELVAAGVRLGPARLARLAGCGIGDLLVRPRLRLGLLVTGDELVSPGQPRGAGQIWESNGTLLEQLLTALGQAPVERRLVADDPVALRRALQELAAGCDVVVSTGGVSAGDSDWIRPLLAELGRIDFWKLHLRPGRPFAFGWLRGPAGGERPFFGLPGNPVAAAITAVQLLLPALDCLEGCEPRRWPRLQLPLAAPLRRRPGRPELARAVLVCDGDGRPAAQITGAQASSRLGSLEDADLLLELPAEAADLPAGTLVWAQLLRPALF
jgi:molybdopterin molybdotransferase